MQCIKRIPSTSGYYVYGLEHFKYSRTRIADSSVILCNVLNARRSTSHTIWCDVCVWRVDCIPVHLASLRFMYFTVFVCGESETGTSELQCDSLLLTLCDFLVLLCCRYVTCMTWSFCNGIVWIMEGNAWLERMQSVVSTLPSVYGSNEVKVITLHALFYNLSAFICWLTLPLMRRSHGLF